MATWQEIGLDSFYAAQILYEQQRFRSSVSRSYYAAFSIVTHQLIQAGVGFGGQQETPNHQAVPKLMKQSLALPNRQMVSSIAIIRRLYAARIAADYQRRTTDEMTAREAIRDSVVLFRYLEVDYE